MKRSRRARGKQLSVRAARKLPGPGSPNLTIQIEPINLHARAAGWRREHLRRYATGAAFVAYVMAGLARWLASDPPRPRAGRCSRAGQ
eukprot:6962849-Alexandrium_andersonii.AAC.1